MVVQKGMELIRKKIQIVKRSVGVREKMYGSPKVSIIQLTVGRSSDVEEI